MNCEACNGAAGWEDVDGNGNERWHECSECGATGATCDICGNPSDGLGTGNDDDRCPMCREGCP